MRRWWTEAHAAAGLVVDRGSLWLPGALAWSLVVGWIPLLVAVAQPPSVSDLTFLGARFYTSGSWPWNAVAGVVAAALVLGAGFALVALAEATLVTTIARRAFSGRGLLRLVGIGFVSAAPALASLMTAGTALVVIAVREFNSPATGDPILRTLARLTPFLVGVGVAWTAGGLVHATASRAALLGSAGLVEALAGVPRGLLAAGRTGLIHAAVLLVSRVAYLGLATVLLGVLWAPIGVRLSTGGIDAGAMPLLVGFVAIWLCLVLGGGALHAWGSLTWTRVLGAPAAFAGRADRHAHGDPHRS